MHQKLVLFFLLIPLAVFSQGNIVIDGDFSDWANLPVLVTDPPNDEHDTDWYSDGLTEPVPRKYSDVDILEVKFTHDHENLYGYVKATGFIGRTYYDPRPDKGGRYYYIITIDVDNKDSTGYLLKEGGYWPNSGGYDMNMEVEFYDGAFNTGHYINHEFPYYPDNPEANEAALVLGRADLENHIIRLAPGSYKNYLEYVVFPDTSFVYVKDRGDPVEGGVITVAVSADGHETEMKAPMWGFFWDENGVPIVKLGNIIDISFSLEGSGELSESAVELGYDGTRSVWGSDTADPIVGYYLEDFWTGVEEPIAHVPEAVIFEHNFPNPFNSGTTIVYRLNKDELVELLIYNIKGHEICTLVNERQAAGEHRIQWQAVDYLERPLPSGVYLAVLQVGSTKAVRRMLHLR